MQELIQLVSELGNQPNATRLVFQQVDDFHKLIMDELPYGQIDSKGLVQGQIEIDGPAQTPPNGKKPLQWHFGGSPYEVPKAIRIQYSYQKNVGGNQYESVGSLFVGYVFDKGYVAEIDRAIARAGNVARAAQAKTAQLQSVVDNSGDEAARAAVTAAADVAHRSVAASDAAGRAHAAQVATQQPAGRGANGQNALATARDARAVANEEYEAAHAAHQSLVALNGKAGLHSAREDARNASAAVEAAHSAMAAADAAHSALIAALAAHARGARVPNTMPELGYALRREYANSPSNVTALAKYVNPDHFDRFIEDGWPFRPTPANHGGPNTGAGLAPSSLSRSLVPAIQDGLAGTRIEFDGPARDYDSHKPFPYTATTLFNDPSGIYDKLLWWYFGGRAFRITKAMKLDYANPVEGINGSILVGYQGPNFP